MTWIKSATELNGFYGRDLNPVNRCRRSVFSGLSTAAVAVRWQPPQSLNCTYQASSWGGQPMLTPLPLLRWRPLLPALETSALTWIKLIYVKAG